MTHWTVDSVDCQNKTIHAHLLKYGDITSIQAIRLYSITRLASIIHRLKRKGVNIRSEIQYNALNKSIHWMKYLLAMFLLSFMISCVPAISHSMGVPMNQSIKAAKKNGCHYKAYTYKKKYTKQYYKLDCGKQF